MSIITRYNPVDIVLTLVKDNFAVGRDNSTAPCKGGKRPSMKVYWDLKTFPSCEFTYRGRPSDKILNLQSNAKYVKEDVRIICRSIITGEVWKMAHHIMDDILIPQCKNFTTMTAFPNMEYNFLEATSNFTILEYSEDVQYERIDIAVTLHKPKVYTLA